MTGPTIDILMATYNGEKYVREQIESVQAQTYTSWRLLVSDDCSADDTLDVVDEMAASDDRISVVSRGIRYGGACANFLSLAKASTANYAMFCDQDDVWLPKKIEITLAKMHELEASLPTGAPALVFTDMKVVDEDLNVIAESFERYSRIDPTRTEFRQVLAQSVGAGCTMMLNRELVEILIKTPEGQFMIMHDWWASLIAAAFGSIGYVDESVSLYRQHSENEIGAKRFSVFKSLKSLSKMKTNQQATIQQAGSFYAYFQNKMSGSQKITAGEYAAILKSDSVFARLQHLFKSGAWKLGVRKFGQVVCLLTPQ